jgi:hypothetical protein
MASNAEIETRWIDAWSDLYEIVRDRAWCTSCLLPDGSVVDFEQCKGWLQDSAYEGYHVEVKQGWVNGRPGVVVSRSRPADPCLPPSPNS